MSYRKERQNRKITIAVFALAILCIVTIVLAITYLVYINSKNYIVDGVSEIPTEDAANSTYDIILMEDILLGGVSRK